MVLMENGSKKKYVADALVSSYKKKGFAISGETTAPEEELETTEEASTESAEEPTKKTNAKKKAASTAE